MGCGPVVTMENAEARGRGVRHLQRSKGDTAKGLFALWPKRPHPARLPLGAPAAQHNDARGRGRGTARRPTMQGPRGRAALALNQAKGAGGRRTRATPAGGP